MNEIRKIICGTNSRMICIPTRLLKKLNIKSEDYVSFIDDEEEAIELIKKGYAIVIKKV